MRISDWSSDVCSSDLATSRIPPRTSIGWSPKAVEAPIIRTCKPALIIALLAGTLAVPAAASTRPADLADYIKARAADAEGHARRAALGFAAALDAADRKSTRLNSSHERATRIPSSA